MLKILKKMNRLLDAKQKRLMVLIVFLMLIGGILESLSISVVIPVIEVLLDPDAVVNNKDSQDLKTGGVMYEGDINANRNSCPFPINRN